MHGGAVHHDAGRLCYFGYFSTTGTEPVSGRRNIHCFRFKEFVIIRPCIGDRTRIRCLKGTALYQRLGVAGNFVDRGCRSKGCISVRTYGEPSGEVVETVVALSNNPYAAVGCEILILDGRPYIITNVVVTSGTCSGDFLSNAHSCAHAHGMYVTVTGGAHLGKACVGRGRTFIRSHLRHRILIHAVDGDSHSPRYHTFYRNLTHRSHGVDLALGIRFNRNRRMIGSAIRVDVRIVERRPAVLVNIRYGSRALKIKVILAPSHGKAGAYGGDAGLLKFALVVFFLNRPAVNSRNRNRAISGRSDIGMVDLRPQLLFVAV